jgi:NADPH2:quinone reductase
MQAWQVRELGEPEEVLKLEKVEEPEPGPGEVLVEVEAAALNFFDASACYTSAPQRWLRSKGRRSGRWFRLPCPR